uniref:F-box domain-containing protein n=1 Tax=Populus alba TaxID=43335 RepID=A0A4U5Q879_POPAL|nr:hypothetical protein D5086_0000142000 [Populus alba]
MEEGGTVTRRWEEMDIDILVKIFQSLTVLELTSGIVHVCSAWRLAACDPWLWKTLDCPCWNLISSKSHWEPLCVDSLKWTREATGKCPRLRKTCFTSMERVETAIATIARNFSELKIMGVRLTFILHPHLVTVSSNVKSFEPPLLKAIQGHIDLSSWIICGA